MGEDFLYLNSIRQILWNFSYNYFPFDSILHSDCKVTGFCLQWYVLILYFPEKVTIDFLNELHILIHFSSRLFNML